MLMGRLVDARIVRLAKACLLDNCGGGRAGGPGSGPADSWYVVLFRVSSSLFTSRSINSHSVHNPGVLPDAVWNYLDIANITVIFENTFAAFISAPTFNALKSFSAATTLPKSAFSIMLHSLGNIPNELVEWTATEMKTMATWNFATSTSAAGEYWHSFSAMLDTFITSYAAG